MGSSRRSSPLFCFQMVMGRLFLKVTHCTPVRKIAKLFKKGSRSPPPSALCIQQSASPTTRKPKAPTSPSASRVPTLVDQPQRVSKGGIQRVLLGHQLRQVLLLLHGPPACPGGTGRLGLDTRAKEPRKKKEEGKEKGGKETGATSALQQIY